MRFNEFIKQVLPDSKIIQDILLEDDFQISVDSRTIEPGDIFFALKGIVFDGHEFVREALEQGAAGCVVEEKKLHIIDAIPDHLKKNKLIILVADTYQALMHLAHAWRMQFVYPVIGITGSVGKTSTKEMIAQLLSIGQLNYMVSYGNQNTILGVALNIFRMRPDHNVAVFEMGISERGEMEKIAALVRPTIGIITQIGHQHMDTIGSLSEIAAEKRMIFKFFAQDNIGIINGDQPLLKDVSYPHPVIKCGTKMTNQMQVRKVKIVDSKLYFVLKIYHNKYSIVIDKPHAGILWHAMFIAAVGKLLKIDDTLIVKSIQLPMVVEGRFEELPIKNKKGIVINDSYNANPESMKAALLAFQNIKTSQPKIAVIGDMLGLGMNSAFWHRQIGRFLRKTPSIQKLILVGELVEWIKKTVPFSMSVVSVHDWQEASVLLQDELDGMPLILVKGSRDMGLNKLIETLV